MFEWQTFFRNSMWILGASIIVASLSFASWKAASEDQSLQQLLTKRHPLRWIWLGVVLIGASLVATSDGGFELAIWVAFTLVSTVALVMNR